MFATRLSSKPVGRRHCRRRPAFAWLATVAALAAWWWGGWAWFAPKPAAAAEQVALVVNGSAVRADVPTRILSGRTMVPIRIVSENLGARVDWDSATRTVHIRRGLR